MKFALCGFLVVGCLVVATPAVCAQRTKVIPPTATDTDANNQSYYPFIYSGGSRTQQVIDGATFTAATAVLQEFAYRRDATTNAPFTGRTIPNYTVTIGHASTTPSTMSTTFASNRAGTQTTVFQGTLTLPTLPPPTGVAPFAVVFKLTQPFLYMRATGDLLLEFSEAGQATQRNTYLMDAFRDPGTGTATTLGSNGPFQSNETYSVTCPDASALKPGGTLTVAISGLAANYPAGLALGFSNVAFGAFPLPLDLTPIGAPQNSVYVSLDVVAPLVLAQSGNTWGATLKAPIPNMPSLAGLTLFSQAFFVDLPSNALGLVWSNGVAMLLAGPAPSQVLVQSDSNSPTGSFIYGANAIGGPVLQLSGSVQ